MVGWEILDIMFPDIIFKDFQKQNSAASALLPDNIDGALNSMQNAFSALGQQAASKEFVDPSVKSEPIETEIY